METLLLVAATGENFKLGTLLKNGEAWFNTYGCYVLLAAGIISVIAAAIIAISKFLSKGQSQFKWFAVLGLVIAGAICLSTGIRGIQESTAANIASGTGTEIVDIGSNDNVDELKQWHE